MSDAPPFPSRQERKACWSARDTYYACLESKGVTEPGQEGRSCEATLKAYEGSCARSWVRRPSLPRHLLVPSVAQES